MLKGKTIIELTDTKTGEVERFEDNNLVTNAINEVILKRKKYLSFSTGSTNAFSEIKSNFISMFPLYKRFFGGIMLFENTVDENRMFLNGDDKIVGAGTFGNAYSGTDSLIGSYNQNESEINEEEKYAKFVYDFATNQGNGTISAVSLGNYHYIKHMLFGTDCKDDVVSSYLSDLIYAPQHSMTESSAYDPAYTVFPANWKKQNGGYSFSTTDSNTYETPILFDDENGYLITLEYIISNGDITYSNVADKIRLHVFDIGVKNVTLFGTITSTDSYAKFIPREIFRKDFSVDAFGIYGVYNLVTHNCRQGWYDKETGYAYLLGDLVDKNTDYWEKDKVMTLFKFNFNVQNYEDVTLEKIQITNKTGLRVCLCGTWRGQLAGRRHFYIKNGYMYVMCFTNGTSYYQLLAKININDSTDVTVFNLNTPTNRDAYLSGFQGDFIYILINSVAEIVFNTKTNEYKYTRVNNGSNDHSNCPIPIKNTDMYNFVVGGNQRGTYHYVYWYGVMASRNDYLATINNLAIPVTKTADKTMKITYVLREG